GFAERTEAPPDPPRFAPCNERHLRSDRRAVRPSEAFHRPGHTAQSLTQEGETMDARRSSLQATIVKPEQALPPSAMLMQLITGPCVAQCISAAAHLGLADRMQGGPQASEELARLCGAHARSVYRLCRALANAGVFEEHDGKRFSLTPIGECLRTDLPGSLAGMAKMFGEGWHSAAWAELLHSVRTGEPAFPKAYGEGVFEWLGTHREE